MGSTGAKLIFYFLSSYSFSIFWLKYLVSLSLLTLRSYNGMKIEYGKEVPLLAISSLNPCCNGMKIEF